MATKLQHLVDTLSCLAILWSSKTTKKIISVFILFIIAQQYKIIAGHLQPTTGRIGLVPKT